MRTLIAWAFMIAHFSVFADGMLINGASSVDSISITTDVDSWTFHANALDVVHIQVAKLSGTNFEPLITLYDPFGNERATNVGTASTNVSYRTTVNGEYRVEVKDAGADGSGDYRIYLAITPGDFTVPDGDEGGSLSNGLSYNGSIDLADMDIWTFQGNALDTVAIQINEVSGSAFIPSIRLYDPFGNELASNTGVESTNINFRLSVAGRYTVLVRDNSEDVAGTGDYELYFSHIPRIFSVPPGDEGGALTREQPHNGVISRADMDVWMFSADALDIVSFTLNEIAGTGFNPLISVYNPSGKEIATAGGADSASISNLELSVTGTYSVLIQDGNTDVTGSGSYELLYSHSNTATTEPAGFINSTLENGESVIGDVTGDEGEKYTLPVNAGDKVFLRVGENPASNTTDVVIQVFTSTGSLVASGRTINSFPQTGINFKAESTDDLRVVLSRVGTVNTIGYSLNTAVVSQPYIVPSGDQGGDLANGDSATGTLERGDLDMYSLSVSKGDQVRLRLAETPISNSVDAYIYVYTSGGSLLAFSAASNLNNLSFIASADDRLRVLLLGSRFGRVNYSLYSAIAPKGFVVPAGDEGGALANDVVSSGVLSNGDMDLYTLAVNEGSLVSLQVSENPGNRNATPSLSLYRSNGSLVGRSTDASQPQITYLPVGSENLMAVVSKVGRDLNYEILASGIVDADSDGDGLANAAEAVIGTDSNNPDSDGDGLNDFAEVNRDGDPTSYAPSIDTDPNNSDSDGDGIPDGLDPNPLTVNSNLQVPISHVFVSLIALSLLFVRHLALKIRR